MEVTHFVNPRFLWLLCLLLPMIGYYVWQYIKGGATITLSTTEGMGRIKPTLRHYLIHLPSLLRCVAFALLVIAIARPQNRESASSSTTEGIDIILAIDVSSSMLARDFKPDRLEAAKSVAAKFITDRQNDRIGLVFFAGESFTKSPLTGDKSTLLNLLGQAQIGIIDDGTAIGSGLATAVNRLKESEAKGKVVILLTDGVNNRGAIAPITAAEIAATMGIKVYTIGVGTMGLAPYPHVDAWGRPSFVNVEVEIDEQMLQRMADVTGGEYYRATDNTSLVEVYDEINKLETTKLEVSEYTIHNELYARYACWGLVLLLIEFLIRTIFLRRFP